MTVTITKSLVFLGTTSPAVLLVVSLINNRNHVEPQQNNNLSCLPDVVFSRGYHAQVDPNFPNRISFLFYDLVFKIFVLLAPYVCFHIFS